MLTATTAIDTKEAVDNGANVHVGHPDFINKVIHDMQTVNDSSWEVGVQLISHYV